MAGSQVVVANDGRVFVSDGYCNARVAEFAPNGTHVGDFQLSEGTMNVPHSVVLDECSNTLLVADRESARVHRFDLDSRQLTGKPWSRSCTRGHVFALAVVEWLRALLSWKQVTPVSLVLKVRVAFAGTWDLSKQGNVYGLAAGPYGTIFALCWDLPHRIDGGSRLALLHSDPGMHLSCILLACLILFLEGQSCLFHMHSKWITTSMELGESPTPRFVAVCL